MMNKDNEQQEREALINGIALRYWELSGMIKQDSRSLLREIIQEVRPGEKYVDDGRSKSLIIGLIDILTFLINEESPQDYHVTLQSLRLAIDEEFNSIYESATILIRNDLTEAQVAGICFNVQRRISDFFVYRNFYKEIRRQLHALFYTEDGRTIQEKSRELIDTLAPYSHSSSNDGKIGVQASDVVTGFSGDDMESIMSVWQEALDNMNTDGVLKTGYQGINRMLGEPGGFFRGDTVLIGALQHNYKSGMITDLIFDIMACNTPKTKEENNGRQPAILHVSLENHGSDDLSRFYKRGHLIKYGKGLSYMEMMRKSPREVAEMVYNHQQKTGWSYNYVRMNPTQMDYRRLQRMVIEMETQNKEVYMLCVDYLSMIPTNGIRQAKDGTDVQELFRVTRNFCSEKKILFITPHQLSTEATYLNRDGVGLDFVSQVAGRSYYAKCKQIDREVDVELVQHIVAIPKTNEEGKVVHEHYLTMAIGKNRRIHNTPTEHRSCALPFTKEGLFPDFGKEPTYIGNLKKLKTGGSLSGVEDTW